MTPQTRVRVVVSPRRLLDKWRARGRAGRAVGRTFQREKMGAGGSACARQAGRECRERREAFHLAKKTTKTVKKS